MKLPSEATVALAITVVDGLREMFAVSPAVQPLPFTVTDVPGAPWAGFTVILAPCANAVGSDVIKDKDSKMTIHGNTRSRLRNKRCIEVFPFSLYTLPIISDR